MFFKIYKIFTILRRSNLKFSLKFHKSHKMLQNFAKFQNFWIFWKVSGKYREISPKNWVPSGVKVFKSCRSWKMLQNDYLVAKIGVDTAENEPRKESCGRGDQAELSAQLGWSNSARGTRWGRPASRPAAPRWDCRAESAPRGLLFSSSSFF